MTHLDTLCQTLYSLSTTASSSYPEDTKLVHAWYLVTSWHASDEILFQIVKKGKRIEDTIKDIDEETAKDILLELNELETVVQTGNGKVIPRKYRKSSSDE